MFLSQYNTFKYELLKKTRHKNKKYHAASCLIVVILLSIPNWGIFKLHNNFFRNHRLK